MHNYDRQRQTTTAVAAILIMKAKRRPPQRLPIDQIDAVRRNRMLTHVDGRRTMGDPWRPLETVSAFLAKNSRGGVVLRPVVLLSVVVSRKRGALRIDAGLAGSCSFCHRAAGAAAVAVAAFPGNGNWHELGQ